MESNTHQIGNATIFEGDVIECLKQMPDSSVHCCITSPPYWGLRDYDNKSNPDMIGLEPTFQEWLDKMVAVSAELWRVLRDDGTFWLNCGDKYCNESMPGGGDPTIGTRNTGDSEYKKMNIPDGFKERDLIMMPARLAIALHSFGWYIRSEIIWAKPNPLPESCKTRPTTSHEKIYLLTEKPKYFYDPIAVMEKSKTPLDSKAKCSFGSKTGKMDTEYKAHSNEVGKRWEKTTTRNQRNVWNIATAPYPEAHFATFPPELPRRCIMAGTSEYGVCPECGSQWERVVEAGDVPERKQRVNTLNVIPGRDKESRLNSVAMETIPKTTIGWRPTCKCNAGEPIPATVLDIFGGSMTTGLVALSLNRKFIGIELSPDYIKLGLKRIQKEASQLKMF